jgi:hypothetical protein
MRAGSKPPPKDQGRQANDLEKWRQARGKNVEPLGSTSSSRVAEKTADERFEERQRQIFASRVLEDWELLCMHALSRDEVRRPMSPCKVSSIRDC